MSLNLTKASIHNNLNYKSSTDQWLLNKEEVQPNDMALNPDSLKTGWGFLAPGMAPDWVWDNKTGRPEPQPSPDYKRAFSVEVIDEQNSTMEWCGTGYGSCKAIETIFEEIYKTKREHPNKLLILRYLGSEPKKIGKGNTRIPKFELIGWVAPDDLPWAKNNKDDEFGDNVAHLGVAESISIDENTPF